MFPAMSERQQQKTTPSGAEKMTFWERLQIAAKRRGMPGNAAYIAKILGVNPSAVTKYKQGSFPHRKNLNTLAKHYRASAEWLGSGLGQIDVDEGGHGKMDDQAREVLSLFAQLPENARLRTLENLRYEARVAETDTTGERRAITDELRDKITELLDMVGTKRQ